MLKRKARKVGKSLVVTIPDDIVRSMNIKNGEMNFKPTEKGKKYIGDMTPK